MEWIKNIKTVELLWTIFVIKLNVNGINIQIKKQRLSNCTKKWPNCILFIRYGL